MSDSKFNWSRRVTRYQTRNKCNEKTLTYHVLGSTLVIKRSSHRFFSLSCIILLRTRIHPSARQTTKNGASSPGQMVCLCSVLLMLPTLEVLMCRDWSLLRHTHLCPTTEFSFFNKGFHLGKSSNVLVVEE